MSFESEESEPFHPVETVHATILHIVPDLTFGKCYVVQVEELGQQLEIPLRDDLHGTLKNKLRHTFYKGNELKQGLKPPTPVSIGDRIALHIARYEERVFRWQKEKKEADSVAA